MKDARQITPAEFQILEILWRRENALSVGEVLKVLVKSRPVAYTTVMTLLDKLARKGSVTRKKKGKAYLYSPAVPRSEVLAFLVQEFADAYTSGDKKQLAPYIDETGPPPAEMPSPAADPEFPDRRSQELDVALL